MEQRRSPKAHTLGEVRQILEGSAADPRADVLREFYDLVALSIGAIRDALREPDPELRVVKEPRQQR